MIRVYTDLFSFYYDYKIVAAKEREKAHKMAQKKALSSVSTPSTSRAASPMNASIKAAKRVVLPSQKPTASMPAQADQRHFDLSGLNLTAEDNTLSLTEEPPKVAIARDKLLEEVKRTLESQGVDDKKGVSLVVIGKSNQNIIGNIIHHGHQ
jgi:elongation factor 1 alpha-like protein